MLYHESKCQNCGRSKKPIKILKEDKKKKKWLVLTCPDCGKETDVEPYTKNYKIDE